jgi:site-specific DNA-cytosine methylase
MWFVKGRRAQNDEDYETWIAGGVVPTLNAFDNATEVRSTVLILDGTRVDDVRIYDDEIMQTVIQRWGTGGGNVPAIQTSNNAVVRRLTPVECERLQGFPDNWTDGQADSNRYKQMGNAVAVPVVEWIISRMVGEDETN